MNPSHSNHRSHFLQRSLLLPPSPPVAYETVITVVWLGLSKAILLIPFIRSFVGSLVRSFVRSRKGDWLGDDHLQHQQSLDHVLIYDFVVQGFVHSKEL